jgi:hypothetical protein
MAVRTMAVSAAAVFIAVGVSGCEPAPPPPTFTVTSALPGGDADPGDGVCDTGAPLHACTLAAAMEEANAQGQGLVLIPGTDATVYPAITATVTGAVTLRSIPTDEGRTVGISEGTIHVPQGSSLSLEGIEVYDGSVTVDGVLAATRFGAPTVQVGRTGTALLTNSVLLASDEAALVNQGRALLRFTTVVLFDGAGGVVTSGSGVTQLGATAILATEADSETCVGTSPQSEGYNAVTDGACSLGDPTDDEAFGLIEPTAMFPEAGSPLVDTVPDGVLGCGTIFTTDGRGHPDLRPSDGDGDLVAACDTGAFERMALPDE